ncbi:Uncharacterised protein [Vibrio cholerae]|nr:Uncharacterised protein [Vibrio cholerae]
MVNSKRPSPGPFIPNSKDKNCCGWQRITFQESI